jgi:crossover junction endodeoxyribonuclease RuvC
VSLTTRDPAARASEEFILAGERPEDTRAALRVQGNVIGIDPGLVGALALVSRDGDLIEVADIPVLRDGSGERTAANAPLVAVLLARWHEGGHLRIRLCATQRRRCRSVRGRVRRPWASFAVPDASRVEAHRRDCRGPRRREGLPDRKRFADGPTRPASSRAFRDGGCAEAALIALAGLMRERGR